ncbi:metallophosphoesterase family protein [Paenibacillus sp. HN-1]|uniref:metallophosphoesterase n=1 Tax=Paenibacillus TaxID=44249 RepID=UPI001CA903E4|nr:MULTISPECIES: metallophosphoesterase [Paenibacillus]MBY9081625.1 metallophosphoesterase family protein [Paenibacillus sp. CGMCC 1.18879]MBY9083494.1 metallophosphoesterase family protein [Paenibacillus sinensis]
MGVFAAGMVVSAYGRRIVETEIMLEKLPAALDGFRILLVTDIHRRRLPKRLPSCLGRGVNLVLLGGDMTEKNAPLHRLESNLDLLAPVAPVYAVHGNHDYKAEIAKVDEILHGHGVRLLLDENVPLDSGQEKFWLTGVDYPRSGGKIAYAPLPDLPVGSEGAFRIILVHDPMWLMQRSSVPSDLVLAGHTHGGQVLLPVIGRRHVETFYHTYSAGFYDWPRSDGTGGTATVFISRGYGTAHLPLRFRSPAEINVLTLRRPSIRS